MEKSEEISFLTALWPFAGIVFLIALGVLLLNQQFNKKLYRQKLGEEKLRAQHQFELLQSSIGVQEEERRRIARDLHDELGAALSMARMHLVQLEQLNGQSDAALLERLKQVREMTEAALGSARRISYELMPPQLDSFGLLQTLESMAAQINRLDKLQVEIDAPDDFSRLSLPLELGLYRVCMELVNNTLRHAGATHVRIRLSTDAKNLRLEYRDNGKGLPAEQTKKGIGLRSIETRIHSLGGTYTLQNGAAGGVELLAVLPL